MAIEKFIGSESASIIFDPIPSYGGSWSFELENLEKNALKENGKNLFNEFMKKNFSDPMMAIFNDQRVAHIPMVFISKPKENLVGRTLRFSKMDFYAFLCALLNMNLDIYGQTKEENMNHLQEVVNKLKISNDEINIAFSECFKEKLLKIEDLMAKEINSEYFDAAMQDYGPYKKLISFTAYLKNLHELCTNIQTGILKLGDFFDQDLDYNALYSCFSPDIFYLLFAKIIYEVNINKEKESNHLDSNYGYLYNYSEYLKLAVKENKKYDPKVLYTLPSGKKIRYSRWQFQEDLQSLLKRHPEAKAIKLPTLQGDNDEKYKDIGLMEKIMLIYSDETKVNWQFLPEGTRITKYTGDVKINSNRKSGTKDLETLMAEVNMRIEILENSGYIGTPIQGLDTFNGYYAFIYPNGTVILEKFWEDENKLKPAVNEATYVMNIDNFLEMSKISKLNLIEYIRTLPNVGVKRIFHTSINNWQKNLYKEINGSYRLEDAISFIASLKSEELNHE